MRSYVITNMPFSLFGNGRDYGEIAFFDHYVIPLSKKLRDCGVFGVSSDENLSYATSNREEWVARGREVIAEMLESMEEDDDMISAEKSKGWWD